MTTTHTSSTVAAAAPLVLDTAPSPLRRGALAALMATLFMAVMDLSAVNVALPTIARDLHVSPVGLELIVAGYGIPYALLLVVGGRLGDAFGRRRLLIVGVLAFIAASAACAVSPNGTALIAARVVQGATAALMVPQLLATIQATTAGAERARAVGLYGAAAGFAIVAGQALGGLLVSYNVLGIGWRGIFALNIPIGVAVAIAASRTLPNTMGRRTRVDVRGTAVFAAAVLALLVPVTIGHAQGWPAWSFGALVAVLPLVAVLVRVERAYENRGGEPLIPTGLLRVPAARAGLASVGLFFLCFSGFLFTYALAVQRDQHVSALAAGMTLTPFGFAFLFASIATGRSRLPGHVLVRRGAILQAVAVAGTAVVVATTWLHLHVAYLAPTLAVTGIAQGLVVAPLMRTILAGVPAPLAGASSGLLNTTQQLAIGLGAAIFGTMYETLASHGSPRAGLVTMLAIQSAAAVGIAVSAGRLDAGRLKA